MKTNKYFKMEINKIKNHKNKEIIDLVDQKIQI